MLQIILYFLALDVCVLWKMFLCMVCTNSIFFVSILTEIFLGNRTGIVKMVHVLDFEQFRDKRRSLFISFRLSDLGEFQKLCFCILCAWLHMSES